jgi:hypothetical protein
VEAVDMNNKGHFKLDIPMWIVVIFYAVIYAIPTMLSFCTLAIIKWLGYLQTINIYKWSFSIGGILVALLFLYAYLCEKGIIK